MLITNIHNLITTGDGKELVDHPMVEHGFDAHGRIVIRSVEALRPNMVENTSLKFFENCDFIAIDKEDAENILTMLNESITLLESGTRDDNDVEVFGDRAISYERLIDALNYTTHPDSEDVQIEFPVFEDDE